MPSKSHRAASRQGKLRERKRRGKFAAQEFDPGPSESSALADDPDSEKALETRSAHRPAGAAAPARPSRRSRQLLSDGTVPSYPYLGSELRRIGVLTAVILVLIVATTFVLGG